MPGERYQKFCNLVRSTLGKHEFNYQLHQFMQPPEKTFYPERLWGHEITTAIDCVLKYARLAKEKSYGYDIGEQLLKLY